MLSAIVPFHFSQYVSYLLRDLRCFTFHFVQAADEFIELTAVENESLNHGNESRESWRNYHDSEEHQFNCLEADGNMEQANRRWKLPFNE